MIKCIFLALFSCSTAILNAQNKPGTDTLNYPELVSAFYTLIDKQSFWLSDTQSLSLRKKFVAVIDSAADWGLDTNNPCHQFTGANLFPAIF